METLPSSTHLSTQRDSAHIGKLRNRIRLTIAPYIDLDRLAEFDEKEHFDLDLYDALASDGLLRLSTDPAGPGPSQVEQTTVLEELGATATSMGVSLVVQYMGIKLLHQYSNATQRKTWLKPLLAGDLKVSFALSEPEGGTDVAQGMKTTAERSSDGYYLLTGQKKWIGGASTADLLIVLARTSEIGPSPVNGITMFLVPHSSAGISARSIDTMGVRALEQADISFDNVRLPDSAVLGTVDNGFRQVLSTLNSERINAASVALGMARGALEYAAAYAKTRYASNKPIGSFQGLQHDLAEAAVSMEAARALVDRAATETDSNDGQVDATLASIAKLAASKAGTSATDIGMRVMGGWGFLRRLPMQRFFRDARLYTFAPVTDEMSKNMIAEKFLGLPRSY